MLNELTGIPKRTEKERDSGVTMVMDKGLGINQAESMVETSGEYIDFVKFGFGTGLVAKNTSQKISLYKEHNITPYFGGTLFEIFYSRGELDKFKSFVSKHKIDCIEVSDGSVKIPHGEKCEIIANLSKDYTVISEVGSKEQGFLISPNKWVKMMTNELEAGSVKVIAEARESGNVGIFRPTGKAHVQLVNIIVGKVPQDKILWEAPQKAQQIWFIQQFGTNVNLGNIAPNEALGLECLRLGLRGDTFHSFM